MDLPDILEIKYENNDPPAGSLISTARDRTLILYIYYETKTISYNLDRDGKQICLSCSKWFPKAHFVGNFKWGVQRYNSECETCVEKIYEGKAFYSTPNDGLRALLTKRDQNKI
jgi:hypothetical protein